MTKDSALVSATGFVHELMWRSTKVGRAQFHNLEALIMAAMFYWGMTMLLSYIQAASKPACPKETANMVPIVEFPTSINILANFTC